jgi:hypothetical protein
VGQFPMDLILYDSTFYKLSALVTDRKNTAIHQRNRSAYKRADVRLCRFSARAGGRIGGHFRVPLTRSQAIVPALVNSCRRGYLQVFSTTRDSDCGFSADVTCDRTRLTVSAKFVYLHRGTESGRNGLTVIVKI